MEVQQLKNSLNDNTMKTLYVICLILLFAFIMIIAGIHIFQVNIFILPPCPLHARTGYYCFGCGGTRAVDALLHGQIGKSIYYHPFVMYAVGIYVWFVSSYTLNKLTHGVCRVMKLRRGYLYAAPILIIMQCMIKNVLHYHFGFIL